MADRTFYYPNENGVYGWNANFRWEVTEHNDIATNTTTLTIRFQDYGKPLALANLRGGSVGIEIIDYTGTHHTYSTNGKYADSWPGQWNYISNSDRELSTITVTLPHRSDGTSSFQGRFTGYSAGRVYSVDQTWYEIDAPTSWFPEMSLQTIPRASSLSPSPATLGSQQTLTISRASNTFTHTINYTCGNVSGTLATKTADTVINWTPPLTLAQQDTTHQYATINFTLLTYSGNTQIGSFSATSIANLPDDVRPTITSISVVDTNSTTIALTGSNQKIVAGYSTMSVNSTMTAKYGASLTSKQIKNGNNTIASNQGVFNSPSSNSVQFTATDSRGYTATSIRLITDYISYFPVSIYGSMIPPTPAGQATINVEGQFFNGSFGSQSNTLTVQYRIKESGGSYGSWTNMTITKTQNRYTATKSLTGLDYQKTYTIQMKATDKLSSQTTNEQSYKTQPIYDWSKDDFNINVNSNINGSLNTNGNLNVNGVITVNNQDLVNSIKSSIMNAVYPVGAIYISLSSASPESLFGVGTWERIYDRFLLGGAQATYPIGTTGGEATHTLTINEMPSHSHPETNRVNWDDNAGDSGLGGWYWASNNLRIDRVWNSTHNTGGGQAHNNMPPYLAVYMWKRTS